jgi:hypothetical protein
VPRGHVATTAELIAILDARILAQQTSGVRRYSVSTGGTVRSFEYEPTKELIEQRAALVAQLNRQAQGGMRVRLAGFAR